MNILRLSVRPSPETNDHQVRVFIDGEDWLGRDFLGLDPPNFFDQRELVEPGRLFVGRCTCGYASCVALVVELKKTDRRIWWETEDGKSLTFDRRRYEEVIEVASSDFTWEDEKRTAERLITEYINKTFNSPDDFEWASARIETNVITLSFYGESGQDLYEVAWNGVSPEDGLNQTKRFLRKGLPTNE